MKPTTKDKQRRHVLQMKSVIDNEIAVLGERAGLKMVRQGLRDLAEQLSNRSETPRGRIVSDPVTPAKIAEVKAMRTAYPTLSQQEIAHRTNVNIGRVSEILHGKRT